MKPNQILSEILEGYSEIHYDKDEIVYFRHPTLLDILKEQKEYKIFEQRGKKAGLNTESQLLAAAYKSGKWTRQKEDEIQDLIFSVRGLCKVLPNQSNPLIRESTEKKILDQQNRIDELKKERGSLVNSSLENFILFRSTIHFCEKRLFFDANFKQPVGEDNIGKILEAYNTKISELLNQENILRAAFYPSFFDLFFVYGESPNMLFGKNGVELTAFQKDLMVYGYILNKKIQNPDIPKNIKNDPVRLYHYDVSNKKGKSSGADVEENFDPRKMIDSVGGLNNLKPEHLIK